MSKHGKAGFSKKGFDKLFQRDNLIILVLAGILLFIIALPTKNDSGGTVKTQKENAAVTDGLSMSDEYTGEYGTEAGNVYGTELDYAAYLEARLEKILSGVSGVGKVSVMVTLVSSEELIVEKDEPVSRSNVNETDVNGGSRVTSQVETNETTIFSTESGVSEPYVVMKVLPKVEGVLVVAEGAGSGTVSRSISEIIQALFDVEVHKIKVVKMEGSK